MRIFSLTLCFLYSILLFACNSSTQRKREDSIEKDVEAKKDSKDEKKVIVFFGDSITEGYGLDKSSAYPSLIQDKIDALGLNYEVVNAGLSGETTSAGVERIDWVLRQPVDVFVLALGGNDGLRGIDPKQTKKSLLSIIEKVRKKQKKTKVLLTGMEAPPNMGKAYTERFRAIYGEVAEANKLKLMPFLLEDVGGEKTFNQADGIHPNLEGQKRIADNVWVYLKPML